MSGPSPSISSTLTLVNYIKQIVYPGTPDISEFIYKAFNVFLSNLVFQLKEYSSLRMISQKIQRPGLVNQENDNKEINGVIMEFNRIGIQQLIE